MITCSIKKLEKFTGSLVVLNYTGQVVWIPEIVVEANCAMDITYFPHDVHDCILNVFNLFFPNEEIYWQSNKMLRYNIKSETKFKPQALHSCLSISNFSDVLCNKL